MVLGVYLQLNLKGNRLRFLISVYRGFLFYFGKLAIFLIASETEK